MRPWKLLESVYPALARFYSRQEKFIACANCFSDRGLRLDAERIGQNSASPCPNCATLGHKQLSPSGLLSLTHRFFVWGSLQKTRFGAAPLIQFNEHQPSSIDVKDWLKNDVQLIERLLGVGFFYYGPRLWMVGEVEPLKALGRKKDQQAIIARILSEYPSKVIGSTHSFYRIRVNPDKSGEPTQYDGPPPQYAGGGRLDCQGEPVLYGSTDLEICVHECRVTAEDDLFVATLAPTRDLRLLDLSVVLDEDGVTEFDSLDMAVHMLFLAGKHAYKITRAIANAVCLAGYDGIIYPSYFSLLRTGQMPFETVFGISHRRIPQMREHEQSKSIPNLALFGRPISAGKVEVKGIDRLIISKVSYEFHYGPTGD